MRPRCTQLWFRAASIWSVGLLLAIASGASSGAPEIGASPSSEANSDDSSHNAPETRIYNFDGSKLSNYKNIPAEATPSMEGTNPSVDEATQVTAKPPQSGTGAPDSKVWTIDIPMGGAETTTTGPSEEDSSGMELQKHDDETAAVSKSSQPLNTGRPAFAIGAPSHQNSSTGPWVPTQDDSISIAASTVAPGPGAENAEASDNGLSTTLSSSAPTFGADEPSESTISTGGGNGSDVTGGFATRTNGTEAAKDVIAIAAAASAVKSSVHETPTTSRASQTTSSRTSQAEGLDMATTSRSPMSASDGLQAAIDIGGRETETTSRAPESSAAGTTEAEVLAAASTSRAPETEVSTTSLEPPQSQDVAAGIAGAAVAAGTAAAESSTISNTRGSALKKGTSQEQHADIKAGKLKALGGQLAIKLTRKGNTPFGFYFNDTQTTSIVVDVDPGSPAERSHLVPGDSIIAVNGIDCRGKLGHLLASLKHQASITLLVHKAGNHSNTSARADANTRTNSSSNSTNTGAKIGAHAGSNTEDSGSATKPSTNSSDANTRANSSSGAKIGAHAGSNTEDSGSATKPSTNSSALRQPGSSKRPAEWKLLIEKVFFGLIALVLVLAVVFYSGVIVTKGFRGGYIVGAFQSFAIFPKHVQVDVSPSGDYSQINDHAMAKSLPEPCQKALIMEVMILLLMPWAGFVARWVPVPNKLYLGVPFFLVCAAWVLRAQLISKQMEATLKQIDAQEQRPAASSNAREAPEEDRAETLPGPLLVAISCLVWAINGMYGMAMADAFMYDNTAVSETFVRSWSSFPRPVLLVVQTLHIKWLMLLSLWLSSIISLGMALSNVSDKPMVTAQLASFDNLIPVLYRMKDPVTALAQDSDRLLAVGCCRLFFEWFPRCWLQTALIMAHCAQIWELPFSLFSIVFSVIGIMVQIVLSLRLRDKKVTSFSSSGNRTQDQELSPSRKLALLIVAIASSFLALTLLVRLIAAQICGGPWGLTTGCIPCQISEEAEKLL